MTTNEKINKLINMGFTIEIFIDEGGDCVIRSIWWTDKSLCEETVGVSGFGNMMRTHYSNVIKKWKRYWND